ncbi:hypothetical protein BH09PLA1_BH09PLA1_17110 [soil metagenome]
MPLGPRELIFVIVIPALAALVILFVTRRVWLSRQVETGKTVGAWGGPLAAGIAFVIAYPSITGSWRVIPPAESLAYLFLAVVVSALAGMLDSRSHGATGLRLAGVCALAVVSTAAVLRFKFKSDWTPSQANVMCLAIGAIAFLWWLAMDASERDPASSSAMPWIAWMNCSTIAVVVMMNGGLKHGQLALALAAAAGAGLLLSLLARRRIFLRGAAVVFAIIPVLIVVSAHYLADLSMFKAGLLLSTPIAVALGRFIPTEHLRSSVRSLLRIAPTALLMAVILIIAVRDFQKSQSEIDPNDPYGSLRETPRHASFHGLYQTPRPSRAA